MRTRIVLVLATLLAVTNASAIVGCTPSSNDSMPSGDNGDASAPGPAGSDVDSGTPFDSGAGSDGGDGSTNACGVTGGASHYALYRSKLYRINVNGDTDDVLGELSLANGVSFNPSDFIVTGDEVVATNGEWLVKAKLPPKSGVLEFQTLGNIYKDLVILGGELPVFWGLTSSSQLYRVETGAAPSATSIGGVDVPADCVAMDFAEKPSANANVFRILATCSNGTPNFNENRILKVTVTVDTDGNYIVATAKEGSLPPSERIFKIVGDLWYEEHHLWTAGTKKRRLQICFSGAPDPIPLIDAVEDP